MELKGIIFSKHVDKTQGDKTMTKRIKHKLTVRIKNLMVYPQCHSPHKCGIMLRDLSQWPENTFNKVIIIGYLGI